MQLWGGSWAQRGRLVSGLVLFAFAATHFLDHALGLVSLDAAVRVDAWRLAIVRSTVGTAILGAALLAHVALAARRVVGRRTFRLPAREWVQTAFGFAIPVLLLPHVVNTRVADNLFGVRATYAYELARIWPDAFVQQSVLLPVVRVHGCIGLHAWLRMSTWYARALPTLFGLAVLLPFAATAGVSVQGRAVAASIEAPGTRRAFEASTRWPDAAAWASIDGMTRRSRVAYAGLLAGLAATVGVQAIRSRKARRIPIRYAGGPEVRAEPGTSLLEVSRRHGIAHTAVCGGRGRCSTCRVLVLAGTAPPPSEAELRTLRAVGAEPAVRLACQVRPTGPLTILPLLKPVPDAVASRAAAEVPAALERDLAVLFVDMRGFTALTESRLPFDIISILNQFFAAVGQPIHDAGGWIANYAGDGVIALFGGEAGPAQTCRAALLACAGVDGAVADLNHRLGDELRHPIRVAMGLHAGLHVMGRIGFGASGTTSVVGLAVNVASRLETMAKGAGAQLALSRAVAEHANLDIGGLRAECAEVRGVSAPVEVVFVKAARDLLARLRDAGLSGGGTTRVGEQPRRG